MKKSVFLLGEKIKVGYDCCNYVVISVSSEGKVTIHSVIGSNPQLIINKEIDKPIFFLEDKTNK